MIEIKRNGITIDLPEDFTVKLQWEYDLYDFKAVNQVYSFPLRFVREGNEEAFNFAHDLNNPDNALVTYSGFQVYSGGQILFECNFLLEKADDFFYHGTLTAVSNGMQELLSKKLSQAADLEISIDTSVKAYDSYTENDFVYFPITSCINELRLLNHFTSNLVIPWVHVKKLIRHILSTIGFQLVDNYSENIYQKAFIGSNIIPEDYASSSYTFNISEVLPDITFGELVSSIAQHTFSEIIVDETNKELRILSINQIARQKPETIDLVRPQKLQSDYLNYNIAYDYEGDLFIEDFTSFPEDKEITNITRYQDHSDFQDIHPNREIIYIKNDAAFFRVYKLTTRAGELNYLSPAVKETSSGEINQLILSPKTVPPAKSNYTYRKYGISNLVIDGNNNATFDLEAQLAEIPFNTIINDSLQAKIIFNDEPTPLGAQWIDVISITEDTEDDDTLNIILDGRIPTIKIDQVDTVLFRVRTNMYFPLIGQPPLIKTATQDNLPKESLAYFAFGRGNSSTINGQNQQISTYTLNETTYNYISADNLTPTGTEINKTSLFTYDDESFFKQLNLSITDILDNTSVEADIYLESNEIINLLSTQVYFHRSAKMFVKKLEITVTSRGIERQKLTGYLL